MKFLVLCLIAVSLVFAVAGCGSGEEQKTPDSESLRAEPGERGVRSAERNSIRKFVSEVNARELNISHIVEAAFSLCATTAVEVASILRNTYSSSVIARLNPLDADALVGTNDEFIVGCDVSLPVPSSVLEVEKMWDAARKCQQTADKMLDGLRKIRAEAMELERGRDDLEDDPGFDRRLSDLNSLCVKSTVEARKFQFLELNGLLNEKRGLAVRKAHKDVDKAKSIHEMSEKKRQWKQIERERMSFVPVGAEEVAKLKQSFVEMNGNEDVDGASKALKKLLPNMLPRGVWYDQIKRYPKGNWSVVVSEIGTKPYLPWTMIMFSDGTLAQCDWDSLTRLSRVESLASGQDNEWSAAFQLVEEFMPVGASFTDLKEIPGYEQHHMAEVDLTALSEGEVDPLSKTRFYYNVDGGQVMRVTVTVDADGKILGISGTVIAHGIGNARYKR